jgi:hypothetical protein
MSPPFMACGHCGKEGHTDHGKKCPSRNKPPRLNTKNTDGSTQDNLDRRDVMRTITNLIKGKKQYSIGVTSDLKRLKHHPEMVEEYLEIRTIWTSESPVSITQVWTEVVEYVQKKRGNRLHSTFPSDVDSDNTKPRIFLYIAFR